MFARRTMSLFTMGWNDFFKANSNIYSTLMRKFLEKSVKHLKNTFVDKIFDCFFKRNIAPCEYCEYLMGKRMSGLRILTG